MSLAAVPPATLCSFSSRGREASSAFVRWDVVSGVGARVGEWTRGVLAGRAGVGPSGVVAVGEWVRGFLAGVGVASATAEVFVRKRLRQLSVCAKGCLALSVFVRVGVCTVVGRVWVGGVLVGVLGLGQALCLSVGSLAGIGAGRGCGAL